jgi:hypothetical protein
MRRLEDHFVIGLSRAAATIALRILGHWFSVNDFVLNVPAEA